MKTIAKLSGLLAVTVICVAAQATAAEPTRAEILKGGLTPERTCWDLTSYYLDLRVDPEKKTLDGSNKISFKVVDDFTRMQVDLYTNLDVSKIVFDERTPAAFTRELTAIFIDLPEKVKKGTSHSVTVFYGGKPTVARRPPWEGGVSWEKDTNGNPWVVVTCSETGSCVWWPSKDHVYDEPDNMTIAITTPPGLEDISNGRLKSKTVLPDGWTRFEWFVSYPINNYCVTFNIGKYAHFDDKYVSAVDGDVLTLDYYVLPENLEKAKEWFKQVKTMMAVFEKYFGKYPFYRDGYKLVECPHTGMEHQSAVAYGNRYLGGYRGRAPTDAGRKFDFIIIHESAHEWWGNSVSFRDIAEMWIHESFGAYAESLFVEDQYGHDEAIKYINGKKRNVRNTAPIIADAGLYHKGSGDMYDKGQLVLNTLRSVLDDDKLWFSIVHGIQDEFKYKNVWSQEVFDYINKRSGRDLMYFFNQYLKGTSIPRLALDIKQDGDALNVTYRWEETVPDFHMPVKVTTAPDKYEFITPTTKPQTMKIANLKPDDFKVAEDLFFVRVRRGSDQVQ